VQLIRGSARDGARVVCLPELFLTPYFCREENHANFALAEPIPGPTTHALSEVAKELGVAVVASLFERRDHGVYYNSTVVLDADGECCGSYRKMHIPDDPLYYEKFYFTPGDLGFKVFQTRYARIGLLICWDQWFPEAARLAALQGAEILCAPTAIGWHPSEKEALGEAQHDSWEVIQRSHAVANGCFVAAVNRVGFEGDSDSGLECGAVIARASSDEEEALVVEVDLADIDKTRTHWPFLRDRRVDAYGGLMSRYLYPETK
jgi:N-carbamoylputrescine amidase